MKDATREKVGSIETIEQGFESAGYICDTNIATAIYLACHLRKPILVEGPPGVRAVGFGRSTDSGFR